MLDLDIVFMVDPTIVRNNPYHHQYFFENRALVWAKALAKKGVKVGLVFPVIYPYYEETPNITFIRLNPWDLHSHQDQVNTGYRHVGYALLHKLKKLKVTFFNATVFMWEGFPKSLSPILECNIVEMAPGVFSRPPFPFTIQFTLHFVRASSATLTNDIIAALKKKHEPAISEGYDTLLEKYPALRNVEVVHPLGIDNYYNYIDTSCQEELLHNAITRAHLNKDVTLFTEHNTNYASGFLISDSVSEYINCTAYGRHIKGLRNENSPTQFLAYRHELVAPIMSPSLVFHSNLWKSIFLSGLPLGAIYQPLVRDTLPDCYLHENPEVFLEIAQTKSVKYVDIKHWLSEAVYA